MMDQIAKEESNTVLPTLMSELEHYNVQIVTSAKLSEIKDDSVVVEKTIDDNTSTEEIASDFVVMAVGARKNLPELSDCPLPTSLSLVIVLENVQVILIMLLNQHMMWHVKYKLLITPLPQNPCSNLRNMDFYLSIARYFIKKSCGIPLCFSC